MKLTATRSITLPVKKLGADESACVIETTRLDASYGTIVVVMCCSENVTCRIEINVEGLKIAKTL
ncbi:hypothetical protein [Candidatus Korobacter versatilis]|uniref:hypothetical protein n=1 Tax=Candidatus Korobacter versatilis TaxID=658062 RepID=UPI0003248833|nr:hypothetical protein [Candidatus Koribacter versatilis]